MYINCLSYQIIHRRYSKFSIEWPPPTFFFHNLFLCMCLSVCGGAMSLCVFCVSSDECRSPQKLWRQIRTGVPGGFKSPNVISIN